MRFLLMILSSLFLLTACSQATEINTESTGGMDEKPLVASQDVPLSWKEVNGFVVEQSDEENRKALLIVGGITQLEASELTSKEILSKDSVDDVIWLTNEEIDFPNIQKGDKIKAWWDEGQPHAEPGILTVPAERLEFAEEQ